MRLGLVWFSPGLELCEPSAALPARKYKQRLKVGVVPGRTPRHTVEDLPLRPSTASEHADTARTRDLEKEVDVCGCLSIFIGNGVFVIERDLVSPHSEGDQVDAE